MGEVRRLGRRNTRRIDGRVENGLNTFTGISMKIETNFSPGDAVYIIEHGMTKKWVLSGPLTIGQVRAVVTESPGREGEELFDNYKPQQDYKEEYMCVETGIGTGRVYYHTDVFHDIESAQIEVIKRNYA